MSDQEATSDRLMACVDCGAEFVWTAQEQEFFRAQDYSPPKRCKPCRQTKKVPRGDHRGRGYGTR